jgi:hypothetical protein
VSPTLVGRLYAALAGAKALPAERRDHWAYCRAVDVVRRINARPTSAREWAAIDAEIAQIRALNPTNWFAEYLRSRAAERNPGSRTAGVGSSSGSGSTPTGRVLVRGSSPEEDAPPHRAEPSPAPPPPAPAPEPPSPPPPFQAPPQIPPADPTRGSAVHWSRQPVYSDNFQVIYPEGQRPMAEQVAEAAEAARAAQLKRWGDALGGLPWSPRCEVVLFPTAKDFTRETGQPPDSPGFSTMRMMEGRIIFRRVHLRADYPNTLRAVVPHEVTHVVLADLFPNKQIPRWADEGIAVLAEPPAEQDLRVGELDAPLKAGRLYRLSELTGMEEIDNRRIGLFFAQSVSLTRYLVDQGGPARFIEFVRETQRTGFDPALKRVYKIADGAELQARWLTFAKAGSKPSAELTASSSDPEKAPAPARR